MAFAKNDWGWLTAAIPTYHNPPATAPTASVSGKRVRAPHPIRWKPEASGPDVGERDPHTGPTLTQGYRHPQRTHAHPVEENR